MTLQFLLLKAHRVLEKLVLFVWCPILEPAVSPLLQQGSQRFLSQVVFRRKVKRHTVLERVGEGLWRPGYPIGGNSSRHEVPDVRFVGDRVLRVIWGLKSVLMKKSNILSVFAFFIVVAAIEKR